MSWQIRDGDCRSSMASLSPESVQTCITSPPYWGLRDYGHAEQIGLESSPAQYVGELVDVFRAVRRVLKDDGTLWLNLGDSYASVAGGYDSTGSRGTSATISSKTQSAVVKGRNRTPPEGLKPKDLVGIPWRVAFALQADGWWLRSDIIWSKPNPMPESVTDRPTKAHEYVFLLTKSERYLYDADAIREPISDGSAARYEYAFGGPKSDALVKANRDGVGVRTRVVGDRTVPDGRNRRTVWTISTKPFSGAHFATMPWDLAEPCVLAGSRPGDLVLDPFTGSGTVGMVALRHGRSFVGCEINPEYARMARDRISGDAPLLNGAA